MTDEILKELWDTKDNIAKEHGYGVDALAEYYIEKQATRHDRLRQRALGNKSVGRESEAHLAFRVPHVYVAE